jgi:hypothetical protein
MGCYEPLTLLLSVQRNAHYVVSDEFQLEHHFLAIEIHFSVVLVGDFE